MSDIPRTDAGSELVFYGAGLTALVPKDRQQRIVDSLRKRVVATEIEAAQTAAKAERDRLRTAVQALHSKDPRRSGSWAGGYLEAIADVSDFLSGTKR